MQAMETEKLTEGPSCHTIIDISDSLAQQLSILHTKRSIYKQFIDAVLRHMSVF
jgi:hypothetical protein